MNVVDTHTHIWSAESPETPWRSGWRRYAPRAELSPEQLTEEMTTAGVTRAVVIPPEWDRTGNALCLAAAGRHPDRFLAFPAVSLRSADGRERLEEWTRRRGFGGLRQVMLRSPGYEPLVDGSAEWLWKAAERLQLRVMVWAPGQIEELGRVVERFPGIRFALDHIGVGMEATPGALLDSARSVSKLSGLTNLSIKLSALPAAADDRYPFPSVAAAAAEVLSSFGTDRVFWGSDFARLRCSYADAVSAMSDIGLDDAELEAVMGGSFSAWAAWKASAGASTDFSESSKTK